MYNAAAKVFDKKSAVIVALILLAAAACARPPTSGDFDAGDLTLGQGTIDQGGSVTATAWSSCNNENCDTEDVIEYRLYYCSGSCAACNPCNTADAQNSATQCPSGSGTLMTTGTSELSLDSQPESGACEILPNYDCATAYFEVAGNTGGTYCLQMQAYGDKGTYWPSEEEELVVTPATPTSLTVWDETDSDKAWAGQYKEAGDGVMFFANYTSSGSAVTGATCNVGINEGGWTSYSMTYNASRLVYEYAYSGFSTNDSFSWNVSCTKDTYQGRTVLDSITLPPPTYPYVSFKDPTPPNGGTTLNNFTEINATIQENTFPLGTVTYNWNGTDTTLMNSNLRAAWNFDKIASLGENTTLAVDITGNGYDCIIGNQADTSTEPVWTASGKHNGAFALDGFNDGMKFPGGAVNLEEGSVEMWLYTRFNEDPVDHEYFFDVEGSRHAFFQSYLGFTSVNVNGRYYNWYTTFAANAWHHFVFVYKKSEDKLWVYVDGVRETSMSNSGGSWGTTAVGSYAYIGTFWGWDNIANTNCTIDEVRIWNRALTDAEVMQHYMSNLRKYDTGKWELYVNQTKDSTTLLANGTYSYQVTVADSQSNQNQTAQQTITTGTEPAPDSTAPTVSFVPDTPDNESSQAGTSILVNVSASDTESDISTFIDFDGSLVGWWRMDDANASHALDYLGVHHGVITGNPSQTDSGYFGKGFVFDGGFDDYIDLGEGDDLVESKDALSVSVWVKLSDTDTSGHEYIISSETVAIRRHLDTDDLYFLVRNSSYSSGGAYGDHFFDDTDWHHIVGVYDGSTMKVYGDGAPLGSPGTLSGPTYVTSSNLVVGIEYGINSEFNGTIDDLMIFDRALSADEVRALYANQSSRVLTANFTSLADGSHTFKAYSQDTAGNVDSTDERTVTTGIDIINFKGIDSVTSNVNSGSASVTVPDGATFCVVGISYWNNPDFTSNTLTLDGEPATLIEYNTYDGSHESAIMYYFTDFGAGSKTFTWDWSGTGDLEEGAAYMLMFFDGVDVRDPVRDHDSVWTTSSIVETIVTPAIDSSATDLMVGTAASYFEDIDMSGGGQTQRITPSVYNQARYACATVGGASPTKTMTADLRQGGVIAASIKAAVGDITDPVVSFVPDTPGNQSSQEATSILVNVSASDNESNISTFIDFDGSLVSWWRMDENDGSNVYDYMGRFNGTVVDGASETSDGYMGKAFNFDGDLDSITTSDLDNSIEGVTSFSVSLWAKTPLAASNGETVIAKHHHSSLSTFRIMWAGGEDMNFLVRNDTATADAATSAGQMTDNEWHHIVGVYNGTKVLIYLDGVIGSTVADLMGATQSTTNPLLIGCNLPDNYCWNGTIDDVMVFNRSLSADEVRALYANQSSRVLTRNFTSLPYGSHKFTAYSQDTNGNVGETDERFVTLASEYTSPVITDIIASPWNIGPGGNVSINVTVTDDSSVSGVYLNLTFPNLTKVNYEMSQFGVGSVYQKNVTGVDGDDLTWMFGPYKFKVWAEDEWGNSQQSGEFVFTVGCFNNGGQLLINVSANQSNYGYTETVALVDSWINNTGSEGVFGSLVMQVYKSNGSVYPEQMLPVETIVNDSASMIKRLIPGGGSLNLASIWNGEGGWLIPSSQPDGEYFVFVKLVDSMGNVMNTMFGPAIAYDDFTIDTVSTLSGCSVYPTEGNTSTLFNYTVTFTDDSCPTLMQVVVDGIPYDMEEHDSGDSDCSDGKTYYLNTTMDHCMHTFFCQANNTGWDSTLRELGPKVRPKVSLVSGWNFISVPMQPDDPHPSKVFEGLGSEYGSVHVWNSTTQSFMSYYSFLPAEHPAQGLTAIDPSQSVWIFANDNVSWEVNGSDVTQKTVNFANDTCSGWACYHNFGIPVKCGKPMSEIMSCMTSSDFVEVMYYNASSGSWMTYTASGTGSEFDTTVPGYGYYVRALSTGMTDYSCEYKTV